MPSGVVACSACFGSALILRHGCAKDDVNHENRAYWAKNGEPVKQLFICNCSILLWPDKEDSGALRWNVRIGLFCKENAAASETGGSKVERRKAAELLCRPTKNI